MSNRIIIAKDGFNALTETNPNNKAFDSLYDTLKYYASGEVNLVVNGSDVETTITHNLGYIPFFIVFHNTPSNSGRYSMTPFAFEDVSNYGYISAYADATKIYFAIHTNAFAATINFKYKIFRNNTGL